MEGGKEGLLFNLVRGRVWGSDIEQRMADAIHCLAMSDLSVVVYLKLVAITLELRNNRKFFGKWLLGAGHERNLPFICRTTSSSENS